METVDSELVERGFSWKNLTLFLLTICVVLLCLQMIQPFLLAVTGAIVLAVVTQRPYKWLEGKLKQSTLAASTGVVLVSLSIIGPTLFFAQSLGSHVLSAVRAVQDGSAQRGIQQLLDQSPRLSAMLQYFMDKISLEQAFDKSAGFIAAKLTVVLGGSFTALAQVVIMLFLLFFLYRDQDLGLSFLRSITPLQSDETDYLLSRVTDTIRATVLGHFFVAGIQGLVAGIIFASLGVPEAALLGIATVLFAMVPSFGAYVVWVPIATYLAVTHHWVQAAILLVVGSLVISTLDILLYPVLEHLSYRYTLLSLCLNQA